MGDRTIKGGIDTWINKERPKDTNNQDKKLKVSGHTDNKKKALLYFNLPFPDDVNIQTGTLKLYVKGNDNPSSNTFTIKRVTEKWRASKVNFNNWDSTTDTTTTNQVDVTVGDLSDQDPVEFDISAILQEVAGGSAWRGLELTASNNGDYAFYSSNANAENLQPRLVLEWGKNPLAPDNLKPSSGAAVSIQRPVLKFNFSDNFGDTDLAKVRVQIHSSNAFTGDSSAAHDTTIEFDSGWITQTDPQFNTATQENINSDLWVGISAGATRYWRVAVEDGSGRRSEWSDVVSFTRVAKGTLTITNPPASPNNYVEETTPPITHTFTGATQAEVRYVLYELVTDTEALITITWPTEIFRSERRATTDTEFTLPAKLIKKNNTTYRIEIRVWDDEERQSTPGDTSYVEATRDFTFLKNNALTPVTGMTATTDNGPGVTLSWSRATAPDFFALEVDGERIEDRLEPSEVYVSGTNYQTVYYGAEPRKEHTFRIEAVVNDGGKWKHSEDIDGDSDTATTEPIGTWLVDPKGELIFIYGQGAVQTKIGEAAETFYPVGRRDPVRITDTVRGYEGVVQGLIAEYEGTEGWQYRDRLERIKGRQWDIRLVNGRLNIPVQIHDVQINQVPFGDLYSVQFEFFQVGDYTFDFRARP